MNFLCLETSIIDKHSLATSIDYRLVVFATLLSRGEHKTLAIEEFTS